MKKIVIFVMLLIIFAVVLSLVLQIQQQIGYKDYENWEYKCMKEYEKSQEYFIFIDITQHNLYLYKQGELVKQYKIASGEKDTPSPIGVWTITSSSDWGKGFGGQWLGLNVPWGTYGIHGTKKPGSIGRNASHGCIRMYSKSVKELAAIVKPGTKVEIYGGELGPFGSKLRELLPGDRGSDVMEIQRVMIKLGYYKGAIDGIYGTAMEKSVERYEKDNQLPPDKKIDAELYKLMGIIPFN